MPGSPRISNFASAPAVRQAREALAKCESGEYWLGANVKPGNPVATRHQIRYLGGGARKPVARSLKFYDSWVTATQRPLGAGKLETSPKSL